MCKSRLANLYTFKEPLRSVVAEPFEEPSKIPLKSPSTLVRPSHIQILHMVALYTLDPKTQNPKNP